jgi:endonuclease-3 related protein
MNLVAARPHEFSSTTDSPNRDTAQRLREFYHELVTTYGPQHWWPSQSAIETIVGAYLTQNTAWRNVERSIINLREAGVLSVDGLRSIELERLRTLIRPSGYMVRKSLAIKAFISLLDANYGGLLDALAAAPVEDTRKALLELPGVGPETADAILLYALKQPIMVVDEYLRRVASRHGLIHAQARYSELQELAHAAFAGEPKSSLLDHYNEFHALIVEVGKSHCRGIPRCEGCPLNRPQFAPPVPATTPPAASVLKARSAGRKRAGT